MPHKEEHDPKNWVLKSKHKVTGLSLLKELVTCYKCIFSCSECKQKYPRYIYNLEEFLEMKIDETKWTYGWNNNSGFEK